MLKAQFDRLLCTKLFGAITAGFFQKSATALLIRSFEYKREFRLLHAFHGFIPKIHSELISAGKDKQIKRGSILRMDQHVTIAGQIIELSQLAFVDFEYPSYKICRIFVQKFHPFVSAEEFGDDRSFCTGCSVLMLVHFQSHSVRKIY